MGLLYERPKTVDAALQALEDGVALSGGTYLTPIRRSLTKVVDLQDLGLDAISQRGPRMQIGANATLEEVRRAVGATIPDLALACRLEAALNVRNQATMAGSIVAGGGRSALLCSLMALHPTLNVEPDSREISIREVLDLSQSEAAFIIIGLTLEPPQSFVYEQVARSPLDLPIICAAAARLEGGRYGLAMGGWGPRPIQLEEAEALLAEGKSKQAVDAGAGRLQGAGDQWASSAYRERVGRVLIERVVGKVSG